MAKKKKKLIKFNQQIRKIFGGEGFDEGIVRLPLDHLIELAIILSLKEQRLAKEDLVKALRRVWSDADAQKRAIIVGYLNDLQTIFKPEGEIEHIQRQDEKIAEILQAIPHVPEEAAAVHEALANVKLKKITRKRIEYLIQKYRQAQKRSKIEEMLSGSFDEEGRFCFYERFEIVLLQDRFHKIFSLHTEPVEKELLAHKEIAAAVVLLKEAKKSAVAQFRTWLDHFLIRVQKPNRYLSDHEKIEAIKRLPQHFMTGAPPIPDTIIAAILHRFGIAESIDFLQKTVRLMCRINKQLFGRSEWTISYRLVLEVDRVWLYRAIWEDRPLGLDEDFSRRRQEVESCFDAELLALRDALSQEAEGLGLPSERIDESIAGPIIESTEKSGLLEIPYKTLKVIHRRFAHRIEHLKLKKQREALLAKTIRDFKNLFPIARSMKRRLIFHVGPTNSGKTYAAMQHLIKADTGYYLAPLRLLALEGYEALKKASLSASLITGEEQIIDEEAAHISSTIEMANFQVDVDICVIDEVQMIDDPERGWAWANAIIGIPAQTVIMTGSEEAIEAIKDLASWLNEPLEIVHFERKAPLLLHHRPTSLKKLSPSTAIVAFSRKEVLALKERLGSRYTVSVVYGNLSPEVRREEARRFREGTSQILIATDAIAMGLNLPIRTLLFARDSKFDGQSRRLLSASEIRQIAGRAGRFGLYEEGYVGALSAPVLQTIAERIDQPPILIQGPYRVMANFDHITLIAQIIETESLSEILGFFVKHMRFDGPFVAANIETMLEIAKIVDLYRLDLQSKYHLACAPLSIGSAYLESVFHRYLIALEKRGTIPFEIPEDLPRVAKTSQMLLEAEEMIKEVSLYLWLSYRFPEAFVDTDKALLARDQLNRFIERSLQEGVFSRVCKRCASPLPPNFPYRICHKCYKNFHRHRKP